MGAHAFTDRPLKGRFGMEIPEFAAYEQGLFPAIQLLSNDGAPIGIVSGVPPKYARRPGDIALADWDYLSDGNIVILSVSHQDADLKDLYGGLDLGQHFIFRIVTPSGVEVKPVTFLSAGRFTGWVKALQHGFIAYVANHVSVVSLHFFANDGTEVSSLPDFVPNSLPITESAAVDSSWRRLAVYSASGETFATIVQGRLYDPEGNPEAGVFYVSENEPPLITTQFALSPAAALRGGLSAVAWRSNNSNSTLPVTAVRIFDASAPVEPPRLFIVPNGEEIRISWLVDGFTLESSATLSGSWTPLATVRNQYVTSRSIERQQFYRLRRTL